LVMERSTVQSCLAAPFVLSENLFKISTFRYLGCISQFNHIGYFGQNRP
jgi:hypothetical protein